MPPRDDSARDPIRPHEERWTAESPFAGEAAEEQAQIHPWYQGYTPFVEGREGMYDPEAEWGSNPAALEAENPFRRAFEQDRTIAIEPEELEEEFVVEERLRLQSPGLQSLLSSQECQKRLKSTSVAVVGGGLGGLMAARELGRRGIKATVFEARSQVGGRVLSNRKFSNGRITEEGAELIGSFHTEWLALAQQYGLACVSRMDDSLYGRECLNVKLTLDRPLSMKEIDNLWTEAEARILKPIARLAARIQHPSQPWLEAGLKRYDSMSVAYALENIYKVKPTERLWKAMEFLLVNNEVAPLDRMNFLGLLCKVKAGQGARCSAVDTGPDERLMGYWNELEIFRSADGCQELANKMAEEIRTKHGAKILLNTAVTHIGLSKQGVALVPRKVVDESKGKLADKPLHPLNYDYVILAIPPSVWADVKVTADGKDAHPKDEIGVIGMGPAVKFFSDVKERFWIEEYAAPSGGSLTLGQVWEGTDNQTRTPGSGQGIVLSVFAGPIIPTPIVAGGSDRRAPNPGEFDKGLRRLYPGYSSNLNKTLFRDWPNVPFIKTGYASPRKDQIFTIGKKLSEPFRDRLFFAGEHTRMDFFGYMEGALRSGKHAANTLMLQGCGLLKEVAPKLLSPPLVARAAPIRAKTASEHETEIPLEEHSSTDYPGEAESPLFRQESFVGESEEEWEPHAAALVAESPFAGALEERRSSLDEYQLEEEEAPDELEGGEELGAEEVWEELEEELVEEQERAGADDYAFHQGDLSERGAFADHESWDLAATLEFEAAGCEHLSAEPELDALALEALGSDDEYVFDEDEEFEFEEEDYAGQVLEEEAYGFEQEIFLESEAPPAGEVVFPSGQSLRVVAGYPEGKDEEFWDPTGSGTPLLDTGPAHKEKKLSTNFTVRELAMSGGVSADVARIDPKLVESIQRLRDHLGKSVTITSGYRSWKRNKAIYAQRNKKPTVSQHCGGRGADIKIKGMNGLEIGKAAIDACGPNIGVGLGNTFAHIDVRGYAVAWNYGGVQPGWVEEIKNYQQAKGGKRKPSPRAPSPRAAQPPNDLVRFAQRVLSAAEGERLSDDGEPGRLTRAALERFRKKYGLGTGGALDASTELALAQRALEELAQASMFARPGTRDARTEQALIAFKSTRQLGMDAKLDAATRRALTEALARMAPKPASPSTYLGGKL